MWCTLARHVPWPSLVRPDGDGRHQIAYEDGRGKAVIAVERLMGGVELDPVGIAWESADGTTAPVAETDRALILQRTMLGLTLMGSRPVALPTSRDSDPSV